MTTGIRRICFGGGHDLRLLAGSPAGPDNGPIAAAECRFTENPPAIDGAVDEAASKNAATIDDFAMPWLGRDASGQVRKPACYEFQVSVKNTQFDCFIPRRGHVGRFRRLHEFGIESAVKLRGTLDTWTDTGRGWSVEMRIPWSSFVYTGGRPEPGDE